jgi:hypothetical protein
MIVLVVETNPMISWIRRDLVTIFTHRPSTITIKTKKEFSSRESNPSVSGYPNHDLDRSSVYRLELSSHIYRGRRDTVKIVSIIAFVSYG